MNLSFIDKYVLLFEIGGAKFPAMIKPVNSQLTVEVKRLSIVLTGMAILAMLWISIAIGYRAIWAREKGWVFPFVEGEPSFNVRSMSLFDYETVLALVSLSDFCWIYGLWNLLRMSQRFLRGEVLTTETVSYLIRFGWSLLAAAVVESAVVFVILNFMIYRGYLSPKIHPWHYIASDSGLLTGIGGVLVILVARIFRSAVDLSEEARLTI